MERLKVDPDGRTLHIYYPGLPVGCHALDRVDVTTTDAGLDVRVFTGRHPDAIYCALINVPYVTTVTLDEPVIVGGVNVRRPD